MLAVDTNVLIRLFVDDNTLQHQTVKSFFSELDPSERVFVSLVVTTELVWVLESVYGFSKERISDAIDLLLETGQVSLQKSIAVYFATQLYRKGADFADALISALAEDAGCSATLTLDKRAIKKAGMTLLE